MTLLQQLDREMSKKSANGQKMPMSKKCRQNDE
jgi:hypothetical protein